MISNYLAEALLNSSLGGVAYTPPANVYLAFFTGDTGLVDNNPTLELTSAGYARQNVVFGTAAGGATSNTSQIQFGPAGEDWDTITHIVVVDHVSNTNWGTDVNVLYFDTFIDTVTNGGYITIDATKLTVTFNF